MADAAPGHTRIIAHRGNAVAAPENTMAAFRSALEAGADGVEFDVQLSRDGVPVVIHDERLDRTTSGHGWVADATAEELGRLDAGSWFDPAWAKEGVPTLEQVLALLAPTRVQLHVELKTSRVPYPGLVPKVIAALDAAGLLAGGPGAPRAVLSSFRHPTLAESRGLEQRLPCAPLTYAALVEPWAYARQHDFQALHMVAHTIDTELVRRAAAGGLAVRAYTVDDPKEAQRLMALGVDGIITNNPAHLLKVRAGERP